MTVPDPWELSKLDVLPPQCSLRVEVEMNDDSGRVRFQAVKGEDQPMPTYSGWSGWFNMDDAPIELRWSTFWA